MKTRWADTVSPETVWREYPRPSFARQGYRILNGLWKYAFTETDEMPEAYEGKILVPFSPEAALSGVKRQLKPEEFLWYRTECFLEKPEGGSRVLLHFGAVDQSCKVYVNGTYAGSHDGGYLPFTLDITACLVKGQETVLEVCVSDSSDTSYHSRGKQSLNPGGMPLASANAIQISGTKTPSISRQTIFISMSSSK